MNSLRLAVLFENIGGYHAARLNAANKLCKERCWDLTAIQIWAQHDEFLWGDMRTSADFNVVSIYDTNSSGKDRSASKEINSRLDSIRPAALFIPGWGDPTSRRALSWCQRNRVPAILMSESKWDDKKRFWVVEKLKSEIYLKKFAAALVGGRLHREYLLKMGFKNTSIFSGYDVVDNDYFERGSERARSDPHKAQERRGSILERDYFFCATRFVPRKNVTRLVRAYARYRERVGKEAAWDLVIGGSGVEFNRISAAIRSERLEGYVHLPGFIPYRLMPDWYGLAKAFIHPAVHEQWGLVINEACASGLPILCSKSVGAAELVREGENGFLFEPEDVRNIATAMESAHANQSRFPEFGRQSKNFVAGYAPQNFAEGFIRSLEKAFAVKEGK